MTASTALGAHVPGVAAPRRAEAHARRLFGPPAVVVRSPGRVNLIGDHTDYNDGLALPMAIDRTLGLAAVPNDDGVVRLWSELDDQVHEFPLDDVAGDRWPVWCVYVQGVMALDTAGHPTSGFDLAVASDLPEGSGLSSSAALELGVARVVAALEGRSWRPGAAAELGRRTENEWVGVATGIMDQMTVAHASDGAALLLDCADGSWTDVELPDDVAIVVLDTGARRSLVGSAYDERRADCQRAADLLGVETLRDLESDPDWEQMLAGAGLEPRLRARVRHVVSENARVRTVAAALQRGDVELAGRAFVDSHRSLRHDYEVSGPELDTMAELATRTDGILGARMTGGGFAGACVALVRPDDVDLDGLVARYRSVHDLPARAMVVRPSRGTCLAGRVGPGAGS